MEEPSTQIPTLDRERIEQEIAEFEAKKERYSRVTGPVATMVTGGALAGIGMATTMWIATNELVPLLATGYSRSEDDRSSRGTSVLLPVGLSCLVVGLGTFAGGTLWLKGRSRKRKEVQGEINSRLRLLEDTGTLQLIPDVSPEGGTVSFRLAF